MSQSRAIFLVVFFILIGIFWSVGGNQVMDYVPYYGQRALGKSAIVQVHGQTLKVEVERSANAKAKGLSGRRALWYDHGMLFVFATPSTYEFWMPNMLFSIDIVWLQGSTIVDITRSVPAPKAGEEPARVTPVKPADTVLEVRAGAAAGWTVGEAVTIRYDRVLFLGPKP